MQIVITFTWMLWLVQCQIVSDKPSRAIVYNPALQARLQTCNIGVLGEEW